MLSELLCPLPIERGFRAVQHISCPESGKTKWCCTPVHLGSFHTMHEALSSGGGCSSAPILLLGGGTRPRRSWRTSKSSTRRHGSSTAGTASTLGASCWVGAVWHSEAVCIVGSADSPLQPFWDSSGSASGSAGCWMSPAVTGGCCGVGTADRAFLAGGSVSTPKTWAADSAAFLLASQDALEGTFRGDDFPVPGRKGRLRP